MHTFLRRFFGVGFTGARIGPLLLIAAITASTLVTSRASGDDLGDAIDALAQPLIDDGVAVGMIIGVLREGEVTYHSFGRTTREGDTPPTPDTVYEIGSITKTFTALLLADEALRGEVALDDPLSKHLPAEVTVPVKDDRPITLADLSTHTSGLPRLPANLKPTNPRDPYADYTADLMYAFLNGHTLRRPPGQYEYSNYAVGLLGHVLATRAGTTYEQMMVDRIAEPLGMKDTRITLTESMRKRLAPPYNAALSPDHNWDLSVLAGAGGIRSTCRDLMRYAKAHISDKDTRLHKAMRLTMERRADAPNGLGMGLGWHIARDGVSRLHSGQTGGYHSSIIVLPSRRLATVVLSNTATQRVSQLSERVVQAAAGAPVQPLPRQPKVVEVAPQVLDRYVGTYAIVPQFKLTVTREKTQLFVQATGQDKIPVFPSSPTAFFYKVVDARITFVPGDNGRAVKLILHQNGRDMPAEREK